MSELSELMELARLAENDDELTRLMESDPVGAHHVISAWRQSIDKRNAALNAGYNNIGRELALGNITEQTARERRYEINVQRGKIKGFQRVVRRLEQDVMRIRGEKRRSVVVMSVEEIAESFGVAKVLPLMGKYDDDLAETRQVRDAIRRENEYERLKNHADRQTQGRERYRDAIKAHHQAAMDADLEPEEHDLALWAELGIKVGFPAR